MVKLKHFSLSLILWLSFNSVNAQDFQEIPKLWARVTDQTGALSQGEIQNLESRLEQLETQKGSQIAVLIVSTTEPEPIEDYSIRVVEKWKLGRKGIDDGILLLVAKNDRKLRIEVGYGLEGAVTDLQSKRIIEEYIKPNFKQGDFYGGISEGIEALANLVNGEELPEPTGYNDTSTEIDFSAWFFIIFIISMIVTAATNKKLGKWKSKGLGTALSFVAGLIVAGIAGAITISFFTFIMSLASSGKSGGYRGGGFSSGGGFSGGGGSFGGGGASGSW